MAGSRIWKLICLGLTLLFLDIACVDAAGSDTGSTILYVYDGASNSVLAWDDVSTLYDASSAGAAERTITSSKLTSGFTLGWGGMALDSNGQYLYLVSASGTVVRINRVDDQDGAVSSSDIVTFTLDDDGTDADSGVFGQVAVTPSGDMLYVTESDSSSGASQIWAIPSPSLMTDGQNLEGSSGFIIGNTSLFGDKYCTGVAASSGALYGYFDTGDTTIGGTGGTDYTGSRLRKGTLAGAFTETSSLIAGENDNSVTLLGEYGCLAYDTGNDYLYVARHNTDSGQTGSPLLRFTPGNFSDGVEVSPDANFTGPSDLRIIAHAGRKDWLVGARSGPAATLWIWKGLSSSGTYTYLDLTGSGALQIRGLALDGSN